MTAIRSRRMRVLAAVALGLLLGLHGAAQEPAVGSEVGQRAPDFTLPSLDGEKLNLYERVEQVDAVLLYFFFAAT